MNRGVALWATVGVLTLGPAASALAATGDGTGSATDQIPAQTSTGTTTSQAPAPTGSPAPSGDAEATAVGVAGVAAVGHTKAHADGAGGSATGNAVELGGKPLIDGKTGGSVDGNGSADGALLDTGTTPLGSLALTPWSASSTSSGGARTAVSDAALARLTLIDPGTATLVLLASHSQAGWDDSSSSGAASSDGAVLDVGGGQLHVVLLHSETASGANGSSYLVGINDNQIGTSDQANGACTITIPSLITLNCLTASGGAGQAASDAAVGTVDLLDGQAPSGTVSGSESTGSSGASTQPTGNNGGESGGGASNGGTGTNEGNEASNLPFTGANLALAALLGVTLVAAGGALVRLFRRPALAMH